MDDIAHESVDRENVTMANGVATSPAAEPSSREELLIAELRKRTAELEEANRELRRVSHYRSLFLARMSHELRTPLTSILGFTEILLDQEELTDTQRRFCQKVQDSGLQLQASLNQLVDLSRIEAGHTEVFLQEFSIRETLRESCAAAARMAQKQQVKIEYELAPEITTIVTDQGKLRQVLFNFIAWAVSRSSAGDSVRINIDDDADGMLLFKVIDNGETRADLANVFDPEHGAANHEPNINELGIIIGRKLLELINGRVTLENLVPRGLQATIQIPARPLKG
ncbi:MAG TPA: histidine kinase dimerization/phospho-acceptor domain-containing protein [Pyrinomonadaceae bacterium]|jgi:signal transduction histidine kinase|nr:histidine kinase dimerization/phospho-acceptor domain-containing protein [Pyrinomonadaceae bacterium]